MVMSVNSFPNSNPLFQTNHSMFFSLFGTKFSGNQQKFSLFLWLVRWKDINPLKSIRHSSSYLKAIYSKSRRFERIFCQNLFLKLKIYKNEI